MMGLPEIKSTREIEIMRVACGLVAGSLDFVEKELKPGVTTGELDSLITGFVESRGGGMAFRNYRGYPANTCISVNEQVVHGIPGPRKLVEGDIVSVDVGVKYKNYYGDGAKTFPVGKISEKAARLVDTCSGALDAAILAAKAGSRMGEVCRAIQEYAESRGFSVVRKYVGHGIGRRLHEDPQIPNFVSDSFDMNLVLKPGMTLAIEPMVNEGTGDTRELPNRWTVVTADGKLSSHFEHTVLVTGECAEILTRN